MSWQSQGRGSRIIPKHGQEPCLLTNPAGKFPTLETTTVTLLVLYEKALEHAQHISRCRHLVRPLPIMAPSRRSSLQLPPESKLTGLVVPKNRRVREVGYAYLYSNG